MKRFRCVLNGTQVIVRSPSPTEAVVNPMEESCFDLSQDSSITDQSERADGGRSRQNALAPDLRHPAPCGRHPNTATRRTPLPAYFAQPGRTFTRLGNPTGLAPNDAGPSHFVLRDALSPFPLPLLRLPSHSCSGFVVVRRRVPPYPVEEANSTNKKWPRWRVLELQVAVWWVHLAQFRPVLRHGEGDGTVVRVSLSLPHKCLPQSALAKAEREDCKLQNANWRDGFPCFPNGVVDMSLTLPLPSSPACLPYILRLSNPPSANLKLQTHTRNAKPTAHPALTRCYLKPPPSQISPTHRLPPMDKPAISRRLP
jgi:hypothetical protein